MTTSCMPDVDPLSSEDVRSSSAQRFARTKTTPRRAAAIWSASYTFCGSSFVASTYAAPTARAAASVRDDGTSAFRTSFSFVGIHEKPVLMSV